MKSHTSVRLFLVPALLALIAADAAALGNVSKGRTYLVRSDPVFDEDAVVPDSDAVGTLTVDTKTTTGRDRFIVLVKKVNKAQNYNVYVEDPADLDPGPQFNGPPIALTGTGTTKKVELDTDDGDALPYDVTEVAALEGLEVRVVIGTDPLDEATIYLRGIVPALGQSKEILRAKEELGVPGGGPDANATGEIELSSKASTGDERLRLKTKAIDFDSFTFSLWIEVLADDDIEGVDPGDYVKAGDIERTAKFKGEFETRTKDGTPLPMGLVTATEFTGRSIQVRDHTDVGVEGDHPYLTALIPQLD